MKLLIAVDMEGITGVTTWDHVSSTHPDYQRFRRLMTADVNAAIRGAAQAGVQDIVVSDGHANADNILIEELDARARLNTGSPSPFSMVQGIDQHVDAVFFVGYHARVGTANAILDHTWSSARVENVWLNQRPVGEIGLNGAVCGHFGAPVLLITGDQSAAAEAEDWLPGIEKVVVKQASGRFAAEVLPPTVTQAMISAAAEQVVRRFQNGAGPAPLKVEVPILLVIEFFTSEMADKAMLLPGSRRLDGRRIELVSANMPEAYKSFRAAVMLAAKA